VPTLSSEPPSPAEAAALLARLRAVRALTEALAAPLSEADAQAQSMPDASPAKWHLAHTTWFFETLVLEPAEPGFRPHHPAYRVLFNSYYQAIGPQHARAERGLITRPGLAEVRDYRAAVDERLARLLQQQPQRLSAGLVELGLHHEQQHQELLLTDLKHLLSANPLRPAYRPAPPRPAAVRDDALGWLSWEGGPVEIGHDGAGFGFDNEDPRHPHWLAPHALADRLVSVAEVAAFIADGGYRQPRWWLSDGWAWVQRSGAVAPLYWEGQAPADGLFTLHGVLTPDPAEPTLHLNLYEADAYCRWAAAQSGLPLRLPTEQEWEHAARRAQAAPERRALTDPAVHWLHASAPEAGSGLRQAFGEAWQWTSSAYAAYPGYRPWSGAVGEYNGKFMVNQYVLRGSSSATPSGHERLTYRNFFPATARWQFTGIRLARDLG